MQHSCEQGRAQPKIPTWATPDPSLVPPLVSPVMVGPGVTMDSQSGSNGATQGHRNSPAGSLQGHGCSQACCMHVMVRPHRGSNLGHGAVRKHRELLHHRVVAFGVVTGERKGTRIRACACETKSK